MKQIVTSQNSVKNTVTQLTQMHKWENDIYHRYGVACGLSDPAIWVLYFIYENESRLCTQNDLAATGFYPKQTINYTVSGFVKKGWVSLKQLPGVGNNKAVVLTYEGRRICDELIKPLMQAEEASVSQLSPNEQALLLKLLHKQISHFEEEITKLAKITKE